MDTRGLRRQLVRGISSRRCFVATKIEAFKQLGAGDSCASHDIEDVLAVVNGRPELVNEVGSSQREARGDVVETIAKWLRDLTSSIFRNGTSSPGARGLSRRLRLIVAPRRCVRSDRAAERRAP